jgi:hypothetical protein
MRRSRVGREKSSLERGPAHRSPAAPERHGQPVAPRVRDQLEPLFGHSFESVRIHADDAANESAREMQASAYTVGQDVFFARDQFDPETPYGFHLLAHELAHTVQQRGSSGPAIELGFDEAPSEGEARNAADSVLAGEIVSIPAGQSSAAIVAREAEAAKLTESQKAAQIVGQFPFLAHMFPGWATTLGSSGLQGVKTDGTTTLTRGVDLSSSGGSLSTRRHVETDKDHSMTTERKVGYADGAAYVESMSGGKSLAEDGTKIADEKKRKISAGADSLGYEASTSSTRDTVTKTSAKGASYKDGKAEVSYERGRDFKLDDDHQMGSKTGVKAGSDGASLSRSSSSRIKNVDTGGVDSTSTSKGVGYSKDKGLNANYSSEKTTEVDGKKFTSGNAFTGSKDGVGFTRSKSTTETGADGKETTTSNSTAVNLGKDGLKLARDTTDAKGNKTSMTAGGDMSFDKNGNPTKIKADAGVTRNGKSVSFSGGYEVSATDPKLVDGSYVVNWERKFSAGGKASAKGVGASGSHESSEFGSKSFKTEAEAKAFKENAASKLPSRAHDPNTVEGAMYLDVGEMRGSGDKTKAGLSASASFSGGGGIGGGVEKSDTSGTEVRRVSPTVFELTKMAGDRTAGNFNMKNFAIGMTAHGAEDETSQTTVSVDISTPQGKLAFETFMKTGMPTVGAKLVSTSRVSGSEHGKTVSIAGVHEHDRTSRTEDELRYDKNGKLERYSGGATETITTKMPWEKEGSHNNSGVRFDAYERNDKDSYYTLTGNVDAQDPAQSMRRLAEITSSSEGDGQVAGKSSGKWGIEVDITPEMVEKFLNTETDAKARQHGIFDQTARNELRQALDAAGTDSDARKKALAAYFAEDGFNGKAIKEMRASLFGVRNQWDFGMTYADRVGNKLGNFDYDLTLEGDKNFQGSAARRDLEGKIESFQNAVKANPAAAGSLHGSIRETLKEVQRQRGEVGDTKRYTDMPQELRERQVARLDGYIAKLQTLAEQSGTAFTEHDAVEFDAKAAEEAKGKKGKKKKAAEPDPATLAGLRVEMGRADKIIKDKKASYQQNSDLISYKSLHFRRSTEVTEDEFKAGWQEFKALSSSGQTFREAAFRIEPAANEARSHFIESVDDPEQAQTAAAAAHSQLNALRDNWSQAAAKSDAAWSALSRITE